ncbi:Golgi-associated RAB2 interactor protein 2 [Pituophis catenifer annectens]|uniref:Golgi-associated RAB2 interactor protein 2 n=1 Tax=Pituophis catenifer annectens TaxID=94852 RepID=UPI003991A799
MGDLQKVLDRGEYIPLKSAPVFESKFVQVNRKGGSIYLHNRPNYVTVGICASSTKLSMPNVMLLANSSPYSSKENLSAYPPSTQPSHSKEELVLTRFLPLQFVDLSVHSASKRRLKLKLVNGRSYYLELCASPQKQSEIFSQWVRLINLLKSKSEGPSINTLYKDFETQEDNKVIRNKTGIQVSIYWEKNTIEPLKNQTASQESTELSKKPSSKRVTYSDVVGSIAQFQNKSQPIVSSDSYMKQPHADSVKQNKFSQELRGTPTRKKRSRERAPFSRSEKRLQSSGRNKLHIKVD